MGFFSKFFTGNKNPDKAEEYEIAGAYVGLRNQVLGLSLSSIDFSGKNENSNLALVMETGYPEAISTLVAVADGSASLYFSNGGGIIGAGEHEAVRSISTTIVMASSEFLDHMKLTTSFPFPKVGHVRFFLVKGNGVFTSDSNEDDLGNSREQLSPLFFACHSLITAIREHTPKSA